MKNVIVGKYEFTTARVNHTSYVSITTINTGKTYQFLFHLNLDFQTLAS